MFDALRLVNGSFWYDLESPEFLVVNNKIYGSKLSVSYLDARVFIKELFGSLWLLRRFSCIFFSCRDSSGNWGLHLRCLIDLYKALLTRCYYNCWTASLCWIFFVADYELPTLFLHLLSVQLAAILGRARLLAARFCVCEVTCLPGDQTQLDPSLRLAGLQTCTLLDSWG